jgi:hypothetical protein
MSKRNTEKTSKQPVKKATKNDDIDFSTISGHELKNIDAVQACKQLNIEQLPSFENIPEEGKHLFLRKLYMERVFKLQAYEHQRKIIYKEMTSGKYQNIDDDSDTNNLTDDNKKATKSDKPKKKVESDSDNDSASDSEESEKNKKKKAKVEKPSLKQKEPVKKAAIVKKRKDSDSDTEESTETKKPVKGKAKPAPKKKAVVSESTSDSDSDSESVNYSESDVDTTIEHSDSSESSESSESDKKPVKKAPVKKSFPAKKPGAKK